MGNREDRGGARGFGLHPIPSVIDLPTSAGVEVEVGGIGSGVDGVSRDLKMRFGSGVGNGVNEKNRNGNGYTTSNDKESAGKDGQISNVKHYDADGEFFFSTYCINHTTADPRIFSFSVNQSHCSRRHSCFGC